MGLPYHLLQAKLIKCEKELLEKERDNAGLIADNTKVFKINKQHKKKIAELEKIIANQKDELLKKEGAIEALTGVAKFSRKLESEPERRVFLVNNNE